MRTSCNFKPDADSNRLTFLMSRESYSQLPVFVSCRVSFVAGFHCRLLRVALVVWIVNSKIHHDDHAVLYIDHTHGWIWSLKEVFNLNLKSPESEWTSGNSSESRQTGNAPVSRHNRASKVFICVRRITDAFEPFILCIRVLPPCFSHYQ